MKRDERFVLKDITGSGYLLPVGQKAASLSRGLKLNETGMIIWELLKNEISLEALTDACKDSFEIPEDGKEELAKDVRTFVDALKDRGMIDGYQGKFTCSCNLCIGTEKIKNFPEFDGPDGKIAESDSNIPFYADISIAGFTLSLWGEPKYFFAGFDRFKISEEKLLETKSNLTGTPLMRIEMIPIDGGYDEEYFDKDSFADDEFFESAEARTILQHRELIVLEFTEKYVLFLPEIKGIYEVHLKKDGSLARFYCSSEIKNEDCEEIFCGIRMVFLLFALKHNLVMLHSVSILFEDKAWLFSASSGTGKSTHSEIWNKLYGTPVINGDLNLLGMEDGKPVVYGTPWCGTSGIFDTKTYPLGGIILLKRGNNQIEELPEEKRILYVQQRLISPVWTDEMLDIELSVLKEVVSGIPVKRYFCNMEDDAAKIIHDNIKTIID